MDSVFDLVKRLIRLLRSRKATTFYLNGPPGSGKTYALQRVADLLPGETNSVQILGPYGIQAWEETKLCSRVLDDFKQLGFLEHSSTSAGIRQLTDLWLWLGTRLQAKIGQQFVVLVDVESPETSDLSGFASLLSSARYLEGRWDEQPFGVHVVITSYWDEPMLEAHYRQIQTSFPYSKERNSATWEGVLPEDVTHMLHGRGLRGVKPIHGRVLYELAGGHPAAAQDILNCMGGQSLSVQRLLRATEQAALDGAFAHKMLVVLGRLPSECKGLLHDLILRREVSAPLGSAEVMTLLGTGCVRHDCVGGHSHLRFRSWYTECLIRFHLEALGLADKQTKAVRHKELVPEILSVNEEAYRVIYQTENMVRNFLATCLSVTTSEFPEMPILGGRGKRAKHNSVEDAHHRADEWRTRCLRKGLPVGLNPLLAYCTTTELAELIGEIAAEIRSQEWRDIATAISELKDIRDSVMHNQLIEDSALDKLYDLQLRVRKALIKPPLPDFTDIFPLG